MDTAALPEKIEGVITSKVVIESVTKHLKDTGVDTADMSPAEQVKRLVVHYRTITPEASIVMCDRCMGDSSPDLDVCPYCLDGAMDAKDEQPATKKAAAEAETDEAKEAEAKAAKAAAKEAAKAAAKEAKKVSPAPVAPTGQTLTKVTPHKAEIVTYTEAQLDEAVSRVQAAKAEAAGGYYKLGQEIKSIYESNIYKARNGEDGKPKYKSFDAFCVAELLLSSLQARRLMDVAARFTEAQIAQFGTTKLSLVLEAPDDDQERIVEEVVAQGGTAKEVAAEAKKARLRAGKSGTKKGRKRPDVSASNRTAKGAAAKNKKRVTVAAIEGTKTIKLYCKGKPDKRAKTLASQPVGEVDLDNSTRISAQVCEDAAGELIIKIKFSRIEE